MRRLLPLFIILLLCAKRQEFSPKTASETFKFAMEEFNNRHYSKAAELFEDCAFKFPMSRYTSDAQFYLAECYFLSHNYDKASTEYEFFIHNFPSSSHYEEAYYKLGVSYFLSAPHPQKDQDRTRKAKEIIEKFIKNFPESKFSEDAKGWLKKIEEKLARRSYDTFRLYLRYDELASALVYLDYLREKYPDVPSRWRAEWALAQYYEKRKECRKAKEIYRTITQGNNEFKEKARERLEKLKCR